MSARKNGQDFPCMICGELFYRSASFIRRGIRKTCGKTECKSASMSGANNPFWGKSHSPDTLAQITAKRRQRIVDGTHKRTGPPKGYKHTPEARAKITAALKERWRTNRDKMLAHLTPADRPREAMRYRRNFTPVQRRDWKADACDWCEATDDLVLDHIIPVMCGGENLRENAQTLCQPCNVWKMRHVDRPLFLAGLGGQGGRS